MTALKESEVNGTHQHHSNPCSQDVPGGLTPPNERSSNTHPDHGFSPKAIPPIQLMLITHLLATRFDEPSPDRLLKG